MSAAQYNRERIKLEDDVGKIDADIAKEREVLRKAQAAEAQKRASAQRATSASSQAMYGRQADAEGKKAGAADKKIGALRIKLSAAARRLAAKEQSLRSAERSEQAAKDRKDVAERRKEKSRQDAEDRAAAKRRVVERGHARDISRLSSPTIRHIHIREPEPEKLRVLYLTASPSTPNVPGLRLDAEVANVLKALRGAKHRDLVDFDFRPAATIEDLVGGLNDLRPHVVHFSGHAEGGLLFDTADLVEPGDQLVEFDVVAGVLAATDQPPSLVVLNACRTEAAVERMLEAAPIVIATNADVGDASAAIFATHFYGAIAAAQPIGHAIDQARAMISLALPDEPDVVVVRSVGGVEPNAVRLVQPVRSAGDDTVAAP